MTTRRSVLHKALRNFDNFTSSSHKLLPFTPLPISSHPCHLFHGFQAIRSSQWCCYSTEIRLDVFNFLFFGFFELSRNILQLCFLRYRLSRRIWANIRTRRSWTRRKFWPTMDLMGSISSFTDPRHNKSEVCVPSSPSLIFSLAFSKSTSWNVDTGIRGTQTQSLRLLSKCLEMCLEGHMWISFLSSSHSADLQTA